MGRPCDRRRWAGGEAGGGRLMARDKTDKTDLTPFAATATRQAFGERRADHVTGGAGQVVKLAGAG